MELNNNVDFGSITFRELGSEKLVQEKLCLALLVDKKLAVQMSEVLDIKYFDLIYCKIISEEYFKYFKEYKVFPSIDMLCDIVMKRNDVSTNEILLNLTGEIFYKASKDNVLDDPDFPIIKDKALDFCRKQNIRRAMLLAQSKLNELKFDDVSFILNKALQQGVEKDIGLDYEKDVERRILELINREPISTGFIHLDKIIRGGFGKGELIVFIAPTSSGKSTFLINLGVNALKEGKKVIHYTFELSDNITALRYDANILNIPFDDFVEVEKITYNENNKPKNILKIKDSVRENLSQMKDKYLLPSSQLIIKKYPSRNATINTLRSHLFKLETEGIKPDLILVDYADIMKASVNRKEKRFELEELYGELRGVSEEYNCPVVTCSQTNRLGYDNEIITLKEIAESFGKTLEVDLALCFSRTNVDKKRGTARLFVAKNRNGPEGILFPVKYISSTFKIEILESCFFEELPDEFKGESNNTTKEILKKYARRE